MRTSGSSFWISILSTEHFTFAATFTLRFRGLSGTETAGFVSAVRTAGIVEVSALGLLTPGSSVLCQNVLSRSDRQSREGRCPLANDDSLLRGLDETLALRASFDGPPDDLYRVGVAIFERSQRIEAVAAQYGVGSI